MRKGRGVSCRYRLRGELTKFSFLTQCSSDGSRCRRNLARTPALLGMEDSLHYIGHIPLNMVHLEADTAAL
jgi:hypothetical protein